MSLFILASFVFANGVSVNRVQPIESNNEVMFNYVIKNNFDEDLGRTNIRMVSYDAPFMIKKSYSDFRKSDSINLMFIEPANFEPGYYTIRFSATNEDLSFKKVVHREVYVDSYGNVY